MRKSRLLLPIALTTVLAAGSIGLFTACGDKKEPNPQPKNEAVLNFVAVTKTAWDADVSFTSVVNEKDFTLTYKLSMDLNKDKTLKLTGVCQSGTEVKESGGNQGGGSGGPGGPGGTGGGQGEEETEPAETIPADRLATYNFTMDGTWSEQAGWGYTVTLGGKQIKVDYDKTQGRQTFYAYLQPTVNNKQVKSDVLVQMQAKDSAYRKTLASDYQTYHVKEATYVMYGFNDNGGNASKVNIYLMPDNSVASYSSRGSSLTYTGKGSWKEDTTAHTLEITVGNTTYRSNAYDAAVGYRIAYSSSVTGYVSTVASKASSELTDRDFEGNAVLTFTGKDARTQADYTLEMTEKGYAVLYNASGSRVAVCTYTKEGDVYTVKYGENTYVSTKEGDTISVNVKFSVTTVDSSGNESTTEYDIALTAPAA